MSEPTCSLDSLLRWYATNRRNLPWRTNTDAYAVWVSEIMLQQTGVSTVIPYFERWMKRFPTVQSLALADEQDVLSLWQGLGYYRRCRNLLAGARTVAERGWPRDASEWLRVPGVGRYTAGAIASIALGEATPAVDGNVERVYARLNADCSCGPELHRRAWAWASTELRAEAPGDWNQALMELGATICTPVNPSCSDCPVSKACKALELGTVGQLPVSMAKPRVVRLEFDVAVRVEGSRFGLRQIPRGEWWEGMWEFPRSERGKLNLEGLELPIVKHTVTHHRITLFPVVVPRSQDDETLRWFSEEQLEHVPLPSPQRRILKFARALTLEARASSTRFRVT